jgi:hypothetical protein
MGEKLEVGDAVLRRILNHTAAKSDVLHRHYVRLDEADVMGAMARIQEALTGVMPMPSKDVHSCVWCLSSARRPEPPC